MHVEQALTNFGRLHTEEAREGLRQAGAEAAQAHRVEAAGISARAAQSESTTASATGLVSDTAGSASVGGIFMGLALVKGLYFAAQEESAEATTTEGRVMPFLVFAFVFAGAVVR